MAMKIGIHRKTIIQGVLLIAAAVGGAALYIFVESARMSSSGRSGQQIFLLLFAPAAGGYLLYLFSCGLYQVWLGLTRYTVTPNELIVRSPLRTRAIPWKSVRDFELPPATFPKAPDTLVLLLAADGTAKLPLRRFREVGTDGMLTSSVPGLAEWGMERVRRGQPTVLSRLRVRWQLYKSTLFGLAAAPLLFIVMLLGALALSWDYVNYFRIRQSHDSVQGQITAIIKEEGKNETVRAHVHYVAWNGQKVDLRRPVALGFADRFKVGDSITVNYLHRHPSIGRIPGWDLDSSQWILGILVLPFVWVSYRIMKQSLANWLRPLRDRLFWGSAPGSQHLLISGASLDMLYSLLPDRHVGAIILKPPAQKSKKPGLDVWAAWFKRAGIEARKGLGKFLILAPDQARRMLDRVGGDNAFPGGYMVVDCQTTDEAERIIQAQLATAQAGGQTSMEHVRFYDLDAAVGPLNDGERVQLFHDWLNQRLRRLYGGATGNDIPEVDFASLFKINPASGGFDFLIERRKAGPRVWLSNAAGSGSQLAECSRGRWVAISQVTAPRILMAPMAKRLFSK
jgi:hypothetical protein